MRNILVAIVLFIASFGQASAQSGAPLRVGVDGKYPPFSHANIDGVLSGLDIDLALALCKSIKRTCNFAQYPFNDLLTALRAKKVDVVIGAIEINNQRRSQVEFSTPYLQIPSTMIVRKDSLLLDLKNEDLRDAKLGAINSSPHASYSTTHLPLAQLNLYKQDADFFLDLANGRIDGIIGNGILLSDWLATEEGTNCCKLLGTLPYDPQINGEGYGIAVDKDNPKLLTKLNGAIKSFKDKGRLPQIVHSYLPFLQ